MGRMTKCGKPLLVVSNIFFLAIGLAIVIAGFILMYGNDTLAPYVESSFDALDHSITHLGLDPVDFSTFDVTIISGPLGEALLGAGVVMIVITVSGFLGVCCNVRPLLIFYCITVAMAMIGVILLYIIISETTMLEDDVKPKLNNSIWDEYQGLNGTNAVSVAWNVIHYEVECCGVDSYADFTGATQWNTQISTSTLTTPLSCCIAMPTGVSAASLSCAVSPTVTDNYLNVGCYDAAYKMLMPALAYALVLLIGLSIFEIFLVVFGVCILLEDRKNKVDNSTQHEARMREQF